MSASTFVSRSVTCLSLVIFIASLLMFARSFFTDDSALYVIQADVHRELHRRGWFIDSARGGLGLKYYTFVMGSARTLVERAQSAQDMRPGREFRTEIYPSPAYKLSYPNNYVGASKFIGFRFLRRRTGDLTAQYFRDGTFAEFNNWGLTIPYWAISAVAAFRPLKAYYNFHKRRRRRLSGKCVFCGYDLRGGPQGAASASRRCPECGMVSDRRNFLPLRRQCAI